MKSEFPLPDEHDPIIDWVEESFADVEDALEELEQKRPSKVPTLPKEVFELRETVPPPMPVAEFAQQLMAQVPPSERSEQRSSMPSWSELTYRSAIPTSEEMDPLQHDSSDRITRPHDMLATALEYDRKIRTSWIDLDQSSDSETPTKRPDPPPSQRTVDMNVLLDERYHAGDISGTLLLAEEILSHNPDHVLAKRYVQTCHELLVERYWSRIGSGSSVPRVVVARDQLVWLSLDHRAGFLLSCMDGTSSVDEILDVCGMSTIDALRIMYELIEEGIVRVEL